MSTSYTIKYGDTLSGIARANNLTVKDLMGANSYITDPNKIIAGKSLLIPTSPAQNTIQTTTSVRNQDQVNLNQLNSVSQQNAANAAAQAVQAQQTGNGTPQQTGNGTPQTTQDVNSGKTNTPPPPPTVESLYLSGDTSAESIYSKLQAQPADQNNPNAPKLTLQDVANSVLELGNNPATKAQAELSSQLTRLEADRVQAAAQLAEMKKTMDAENQAAVDSINTTFAARRDKLNNTYAELANSRAKAGYATDAFRYTPQLSEGLITNDEQNHIMALTQLDAEMRSALAQAATAKRQGDWELLGKMMDLYNKSDTDRTNTLSKLITLSQDTNKKIAAEQKIAANINKLPSATDAAKLAAAAAPAIREALAGMNVTQISEFIKQKAEAMKIDPDILKSAVLTQEQKDALAQQKLEHEKALTDKALRPTGGGGKGGGSTVSEQRNAAFGEIEDMFVKNPKFKNGVPFADPNGFLTPQGFKTLLSFGIQKGLTRDAIIKQYKGKFNKTQLSTYGLTAAEKKLVK